MNPLLLNPFRESMLTSRIYKQSRTWRTKHNTAKKHGSEKTTLAERAENAPRGKLRADRKMESTDHL